MDFCKSATLSAQRGCVSILARPKDFCKLLSKCVQDMMQFSLWLHSLQWRFKKFGNFPHKLQYTCADTEHRTAQHRSVDKPLVHAACKAAQYFAGDLRRVHAPIQWEPCLMQVPFLYIHVPPSLHIAIPGHCIFSSGDAAGVTGPAHAQTFALATLFYRLDSCTRRGALSRQMQMHVGRGADMQGFRVPKTASRRLPSSSVGEWRMRGGAQRQSTGFWASSN